MNLMFPIMPGVSAPQAPLPQPAPPLVSPVEPVVSLRKREMDPCEDYERAVKRAKENQARQRQGKSCRP